MRTAAADLGLTPIRTYEDAVSHLLEEHDTGMRATIRSDFPVTGMPEGTLGYDATFVMPVYNGRSECTVHVYFTWNSNDEAERCERFRELFNFLATTGAQEGSLSVGLVSAEPGR